MKRLLGLSIFLLIGCLPAQAQKFIGPSISEGGSIGGGSHLLPVYPDRAFNAINVSGSDTDFEPSSFRSYDQAVKEGKAALAEHAKTLAEAAKETKKSERPKAKIILIQDAGGNLVLASNSQ